MRESKRATEVTVLFTAFALLSLGLCYGVVSAEQPEKEQGVPRVMSYEGFITGVGGDPLPNGQYDFRFAIYAEPEGGEPLWMEDHRSVNVIDGIVRVLLGEGKVPNPLELPFDRQYYLGITIGDDPEMTPRLQLMATAYSFRAKVADEVPDLSITTEKLAEGAVTDEKISSVSWSKITDLPNLATVDGTAVTQKSVPSNVWHTKGNTKTDPEQDFIGTGDATDLVFRTDNKEAMRIDQYGKITMKGALTVEDYITSRKSPNEGGFLLADPNHGLKRVGNNNVRLFTTGGHLLLEGGNVGIGTSYPTGKLHVNNGNLVLENGSLGIGTTWPYQKLHVKDGNVAVSGDSVLVGIGTTAPKTSLHVKSRVTEGTGGPSGYPVWVDGNTQGIAISVDKHLGVGGLSPNSNNHFVTFFANHQHAVGTIKGMDTVDWLLDWQHALAIGYDLVEVAFAAADLGGALAGGHVCAGVGAVACPPSPGDIAGSVIKVALIAGRVIFTQVQHSLNLVPWGGVSYSSGWGDYAEWLRRANESEQIDAGDIVGVFGGKVTRKTAGAQQMMVVSKAPIVLGNQPPEGEEHLCEKVAFLGQVRVKVMGPVTEGDYVIPSGLNDGTGIAVSPELMTADEYAKAVGRSWETLAGQALKQVNIAVGVNQGDIAKYVARQQLELQAMMDRLAAREEAFVETQKEVDELKARVAGLSGVQADVEGLKAAVRAIQGYASAEGRVVSGKLRDEGN